MDSITDFGKSIGAGILTLALFVGVGAALFATSPDSARYDRPESQFLSARFVPALSVAHDGASASLLGRF